MKKNVWKWLLIVAVVCLFVVTMTACGGDGSEIPGGEDLLKFETVYAYAVEAGYTGTMDELVELFKGDSAYALACQKGYTGTEEEWLNSLVGANGKDGVSPTIGENGHWWIGELDTGVTAKGEQGEQGIQGEKGDTGATGRGIERVYINEEGNLIVVYTDATENVVGKLSDGCNCEAHQHEIVEKAIVEKEPTCTQTGITYIICETCREVVKTIITDKKQHEYTDVVTSPTCTEQGYTTHTCIDCGDVKIDSYVPARHVEVVDEAVDPTCTETGLTEGCHCSVCNEVFIEQEIIPALGHNYVEGICTNCGDSEIIETEGLVFTLKNDDTYEVSGYTGVSTVVNIAPRHDGKAVTSIGQTAFSGSNFSSITIPDSIIEVGAAAFNNCSRLTSVYYSGDIASWCNITFDEDWNQMSNPLRYAHYLYINNSIVKELVIPDTITEIKKYTFVGWYGTKVIIPDSVTKIGIYAFRECYSLTNITIPEHMAKIEDCAFLGCYKLIEVYNKSSLSIVKGNNKNGYVGYYAKNIYTEEGGSKISIDNDGYEIYEEDDEKLLLSYSGNDTELILPDGITEIYKYAFLAYNSSLISVQMPNTVICIGDCAFQGCCNLTEVTISTSATSIGNYAFYSCQSLTSITIPDSVNSICFDAFSGCTGLTSVILGSGVRDIGMNAFYGTRASSGVFYTGDIVSWCEISFHSTSPSSNPLAGARKLYIDNTLVMEIVLPETVTEIKACAFAGWNGTSITIPNSVTSIGAYAFDGCKNLTEMTIPDSVVSIGRWAFDFCTFESITLGSGVKTIAESMFPNNYSHLQNVYYTGDIASWCDISFSAVDSNPLIYAHNLYVNNILITEITLPDDLTEIKNYAFCGWNGTGITIPDSVVSIGNGAFYNCKYLTNINIPDSITSIGQSAFYNCPCLTTDNGIQYMDTWLIRADQNLTTVSIKSGTKRIEDSAFFNCMNLTNITIPDSLVSIGSNAFNNCTGLTSITIPDSVTSIGSNAFYNCTGLTSITIPDSVNSIESYAFYKCTGLTSITIPDSVMNIGEKAFLDCTSLTSITFAGTMEKWSAISKGGDWNYNTGAYTIHCTDGDIAK